MGAMGSDEKQKKARIEKLILEKFMFFYLNKFLFD
jgi:hypothetical protein